MEKKQQWLNDKSIKEQVTGPIFIFFSVILLLLFIGNSISHYVELRNVSNLFEATGKFQHTNRILLHYNSITFEIDCGNLNFDTLKELINPLYGNSFQLIGEDKLTGLMLYMEIDYFIDERMLFRANIYKVPLDFVFEEGCSNFWVMYNRSFFIQGNRGLLFLSDYNRNLLSRFMTRTLPLSGFSNNYLDIDRVLELIQ